MYSPKMWQHHLAALKPEEHATQLFPGFVCEVTQVISVVPLETKRLLH